MRLVYLGLSWGTQTFFCVGAAAHAPRSGFHPELEIYDPFRIGGQIPSGSVVRSLRDHGEEYDHDVIGGQIPSGSVVRSLQDGDVCDYVYPPGISARDVRYVGVTSPGFTRS